MAARRRDRRQPRAGPARDADPRPARRVVRGRADRAQDAYALAYRAVSDLAELGGTDGLTPLFHEWGRSRSLERAMRGAYGITMTEFEARWRDRTRRRYGGLALSASLAVLGTIV